MNLPPRLPLIILSKVRIGGPMQEAYHLLTRRLEHVSCTPPFLPNFRSNELRRVTTEVLTATLGCSYQALLRFRSNWRLVNGLNGELSVLSQ